MITRLDGLKSTLQNSYACCRMLLDKGRNITESGSQCSWLTNNDPSGRSLDGEKQKSQRGWKPKLEFRLAVRILSDAARASDVRFDGRDILMFTDWMDYARSGQVYRLKTRVKQTSDCATLASATIDQPYRVDICVWWALVSLRR